MFMLAFYNQYFKKIYHLLLTSEKSALIIKFNTKTILKINFVTCTIEQKEQKIITKLVTFLFEINNPKKYCKIMKTIGE